MDKYDGGSEAYGRQKVPDERASADRDATDVSEAADNCLDPPTILVAAFVILDGGRRTPASIWAATFKRLVEPGP
jgi:hypothetical protein